MTLQKNKIKFGFNEDKGFPWWYKKCNGSLEGKKKTWNWNKTKQNQQKNPTTPREGKKLKQIPDV